MERGIKYLHVREVNSRKVLLHLSLDPHFTVVSRLFSWQVILLKL